MLKKDTHKFLTYNSSNTFFNCFLLIVFFSFYTSISYSKQLNVCKTCKYNNIQEAINEAMSFDTVLVQKGKYELQSTISIKKPLFLIGENFPEIDGKNKLEILLIEADNVTVQGLHLMNSGISSIKDIAGIRVSNAKNVKLFQNKLTNTFFGIYLAKSSNVLIYNNLLEGQAKEEYNAGNGIHFWKCTKMKVKYNIIKGHRDGIYLEFTDSSDMFYNISFRNHRYGLHFMFSNDDSYEHNVFKENNAGVAVMYSKRIFMKNNLFANNWGAGSYGLLLKDISDGKILNNVFDKNTTAIYLEGCTRNKIKSNNFTNNGWAMKLLANCVENVLQYNNFINNTFDVSTNGTLALNHLSENYWDKYQGYDLNKDKIGDIPYHPVTMYSTVVERIPYSIILVRSFIVSILDKIENALPAIIPDQLMDIKPLMKQYNTAKKDDKI